MKTKSQQDNNGPTPAMDVENHDTQQQNQQVEEQETILPSYSLEKDEQIPLNKLSEQAQLFIKLFTKFDNEFAYEKTQIYYLLSIPWFEKWKKYVGYEAAKSGSNKHDQFFGAQHPGIFNDDLLEDKQVQQQYLRNSKQPSLYDVILKPFLKNQSDYFIISKEIMEMFIEYYCGFVIPRKAFIEADGNKKVEVYLKTITALIINTDILKDADLNRIQEFRTYLLQISNNMTIQQTKKELLSILTYFLKEKSNSSNFQYNYSSFSSSIQATEQIVRLWKLDSSIQIDEAFEYVRKICKSTQGYDYQIQMQGQFLEKDPTMKISDLGLLDKDIFIIEIREDNKGWFFVQDGVASMDKCDFCYKFGNWKISCGCKQVKYCSDECKQRDSRYHMMRCDKAGESDEENEDFSFKQNSIRGLCGLNNLGNTCFMNSALQCLSNTYKLTEYFLNKHYTSEINLNNPLGSQGKLAQKYAHLLKNLWIETNAVFSPYGIKSAVAKLNPIFDGYQQHDSSEFLSYLIDGLHEDLNRIKQKPATEYTESNGRPDDVVARENWNIFLKRNQSVIVDNFYGLYKSKITCPDCSKISITFDPFLSLPIQIPMKNEKQIQFHVVFADNKELPIKCSLSFQPKSHTVKDLRQAIGNLIDDINPDNLLFTYLSYQSSKRDIQDDQPTTEVKKRVKYAMQLFAFELSPLDMQIPQNQQIVINVNMQKNVQYYQNTNIKRSFTVVRPFLFSRQDTGKTIHMKVLKHFRYFIIDQAEVFGRRREQLQMMNDEQFFDEVYNKMNKPYSLNWVTNCRGYFNCYYCQKSNCDNCPVELSDDTENNTIEKKISGVPSYFEIEFDAMWDNIPDKLDLNKFNDVQNLEDYLKKKQQENDAMIDEKCNDDKNLQKLQSQQQKQQGDQNTNLKQITNQSDEEEKKAADGIEIEYQSATNNKNHNKMDKLEKKISIYSCLQQFSEEEKLGENNTWYCNKCQKHQQAYKQMQIYIVPKHLIIQLKRFRQISSNSMFQNAKRINTLIDFPLENLDLTDYILNKKLPQELSDADILVPPLYNNNNDQMQNENGVQKQEQFQQEQQQQTSSSSSGTIQQSQQQQQQQQVYNNENQIKQKSNPNQRLLYDCYAISNHYGNVGFGHYTAFAKNELNNNWYEFDDSSVRDVNDSSKIISSASYLLFYRRKEY